MLPTDEFIGHVGAGGTGDCHVPEIIRLQGTGPEVPEKYPPNQHSTWAPHMLGAIV